MIVNCDFSPFKTSTPPPPHKRKKSSVNSILLVLPPAMPSVAVQLYSVVYKLLLRHRLQARLQNPPFPSDFGLTCRPDESVAAANPTFADGVATKDVHIDLVTSLSVRIFLPDSNGISPAAAADGVYKGYLPPSNANPRRLPVVLQFHGGGFVEGSNVSVSNDFFCRRIAKLCDVIVVAVGYRLAPESRFPAAFDDGVEALNWLGKQANLAEYGRSMGRRVGEKRDMVRTFGDAIVEPWIAAHGDPSRCVLLGVSCGANIANWVARKAVEAGNKLVRPVKVVAQVLMYPFFMGSEPTRTETKLANSYFYDRSMCVLAWKLLLTEEEFSPDHPAANPLAPGPAGPPLLRQMPPTLTVVAEHDWMRERAIAYSEELRKVNVDAPVLEYKDSVHEFATLDILLKTPKAQACAEDIAIWVKKYISNRGHEFSY